MIILESHSDYTDNSKALFNEMLKHKINDHYKIYWLVEDVEKFKEVDIYNVKFLSINRSLSSNLKEYYKKIVSKIQLIFLLNTYQYYFFSHRDFTINSPKKNQITINLTHGTPLKDIRGKMTSTKNNTYFITTSDFSKELNILAYKNEQISRKMKNLGFPRNDLLFQNKNVIKSLNINKNEYNKIMIWMPTFRHHKNGSRSDVGNFVTKGDLPIIENKHSWKSLNSYLRKYNMMLIIKPHPAQSIQWFSAENNTNIRTVTNDDLFAHSIELYNLLGECDALITDYSSVYLDYLLLNKPVAFTTDDINEYRNNLGFLVDNIYDYMPGHKINNIEDFKIFIYDLANSIDKYEIKRLEVRKKFNKHLDGKSSERILRYLNLIK